MKKTVSRLCCAAGELVRVVAVGGSVSTGMGAAELEQSYLHRVVAWLRSLGDARHPVRVEARTPLCMPPWPALSARSGMVWYASSCACLFALFALFAHSGMTRLQRPPWQDVVQGMLEMASLLHAVVELFL
jgi:hypothetical protein